MLKALIGFAASCLLASFTVHAQAVNCISAASDSDGDGWGWENGASCVVVSPQAPASGDCAYASSDPDGDGWGWENGASCRVTNGSSLLPPPQGNQPDQTGDVIANFTGTLIGTEADTHYFTLTNATSVSITGLDMYNSELLLFDSNGSLIWQDSYWYGDLCLPSGSYTVQVNQNYTSTLEPQNYSLSIIDRNVTCVAPSSTVSLGSSADYALITSNGTVLTSTYENNQGITAYDRNGTRLWSISNADYIDAAESHSDGSILLAYVSSDSRYRIAYVEANGNIRWTNDDNYNYVYAISINSNTAALSNGTSITAVNLNDGTVKFKYDYPIQYSLTDPRVLEDGSIISTVIDYNGAAQILTFD